MTHADTNPADLRAYANTLRAYANQTLRDTADLLDATASRIETLERILNQQTELLDAIRTQQWNVRGVDIEPLARLT